MSNQDKLVSLISNHIEITADLPYEIEEGCFLRRASEKEVEFIVDAAYFADISQSGLNLTMPVRFEGRTLLPGMVGGAKRNESGSMTASKILTPEEWRLWVIESSYETGVISEERRVLYNMILLLLDPRLELAYHIAYEKEDHECIYPHMWGPAIGYENWRICKSMDSIYRYHDPVVIGMDFLESFKLLLMNVTNFGEEYKFITRALNIYDDLLNIPRSSGFLAVGYFSIIELLITHLPNGNEMGDSIRRQLRTKLELLRNHYQSEIDPSEYFEKEITSKTLWTKLYDYRCVIAHGGFSNFKDSFQTLKSLKNVIEFLDKIVIELLIFAIKNPRLIADIKPC